MRNITGVILAAALFITLLTACVFPRINEDLFLGLCLGREVAQGTFTDPNSWSFVRPVQVFVDRAWLSHVLHYWSYALLGSLGPLSIKAILLACYLVILYCRCRWLGVSREVSIFALTLGTFALTPFLSIRSENFGLLCFLALTTFLTASPSWGGYRQVGAVLVVVLWSNCHGTWPLGVVLIGIRFVLDLIQARGLLVLSCNKQVLSEALDRSSGHRSLLSRCADYGRQYGSHPIGWFVAAMVVLPLIFLVNPFGWRSFLVFDYVWSMNQFERISAWGDNRPLIQLSEILGRSFYSAWSVLPFLVILLLLMLLILTMLIFRRPTEAVAWFAGRPTIGDKWMEVATLILLILIAFKWRRLITFAAPGLVPMLALLIEANMELVYERFTLSGSRSSYAVLKRVPSIVATAALALAGLLFYTCVVRSYLPNNPMAFLRVAPPLQERMMSYDLAWKDVVEFMRRNHISGRIMASMQLADYLLLNLTDVRIFMDLRAQAAYTPANFADYFAVVRARPGSANRAAEILDRFQVDFVVLDSVGVNHFPAAWALMETGKWACIYKDSWVYALARSDSEIFKSVTSTGRLDTLWYKTPEMRYISEAFLSQFIVGSIPEELLGRVKKAAREFPDPDVYVLLAMAMRGTENCLPEDARNYLREEALRLSRSDYMVSAGVHDIVDSAIRLYRMLAADAMACGQTVLGRTYDAYADRMVVLSRRLCRKYNVLSGCW